MDRLTPKRKSDQPLKSGKESNKKRRMRKRYGESLLLNCEAHVLLLIASYSSPSAQMALVQTCKYVNFRVGENIWERMFRKMDWPPATVDESIDYKKAYKSRISKGIFCLDCGLPMLVGNQYRLCSSCLTNDTEFQVISAKHIFQTYGIRESRLKEVPQEDVVCLSSANSKVKLRKKFNNCHDEHLKQLKGEKLYKWEAVERLKKKIASSSRVGTSKSDHGQLDHPKSTARKVRMGAKARRNIASTSSSLTTNSFASHPNMLPSVDEVLDTPPPPVPASRSSMVTTSTLLPSLPSSGNGVSNANGNQSKIAETTLLTKLLEYASRCYHYIFNKQEGAMQDRQEEVMHHITPKEWAVMFLSTPGYEIVAEGFNLELRKYDMSCMISGQRLKDEVINFYIHLVDARNRALANSHRVLIFNTMFYSLFTAKQIDSETSPNSCFSYDRVRRWLKKIDDFFGVAKLIVPILIDGKESQPGHWVMIVADFAHQKIEYCDSLVSEKLGDSDKTFRAIRELLVREGTERGVNVDIAQWQNIIRDVPQQSNRTDSSIFMLQFIARASQDAPFTFTQGDIDDLRMLMVYEIVQKKIF